MPVALTNCKECKHEVSTTANKCPNCGVSTPGVTNKEAAKGCSIMLVIFVLAIWFILPSDDGPQEFGVTVDYTIVSDESLGPIRRSVDVLLTERISESQLEAVANEIHAMESPTPERTFIGYRLADQDTESPYWATTHFNPDLDVRVLGEAIGGDDS